jgi:hypothetical protein
VKVVNVISSMVGEGDTSNPVGRWYLGHKLVTSGCEIDSVRKVYSECCSRCSHAVHAAGVAKLSLL